MKKILSLALAAMMLFSFCVSVTAVTDAKQRLGDINADGNIDTYDYLLATRAYFGTVKLSDGQKTAADVTLDGSIDSMTVCLSSVRISAPMTFPRTTADVLTIFPSLIKSDAKYLFSATVLFTALISAIL